MKKRILKEELAYVCAQRNYQLAQKSLRLLKNREGSSEEELARAKEKVEKLKVQVREAGEAMQRAGLSKGSI